MRNDAQTNPNNTTRMINEEQDEDQKRKVEQLALDMQIAYDLQMAEALSAQQQQQRPNYNNNTIDDSNSRGNNSVIVVGRPIQSLSSSSTLPIPPPPTTTNVSSSNQQRSRNFGSSPSMSRKFRRSPWSGNSTSSSTSSNTNNNTIPTRLVPPSPQSQPYHDSTSTTSLEVENGYVNPYREPFHRDDMLYVPCEVENQFVEMMIDSGASTSAMSKDVMEKLQLQSCLNRTYMGQAIGCGSANIVGIVENVAVSIGHVEFRLYFIVLDTSNSILIMGLDQLKRFKCLIDLEENKLIFGGKGGVEVQFLPPSNTGTGNSSSNRTTSRQLQQQQRMQRGDGTDNCNLM